MLTGAKPSDQYASPIAQDPDHWSLPGAPDKFNPNDKPPQPIGQMGDDAPWIGCKPDLGVPDDLDRFFTNCKVYFQVHSVYMWLDPYQVAFATSYFEKRAKEWWILELSELRSRSRGKFRFLLWDNFVKMTREKFRDPAIKDVHKKKMYDARMGARTVSEYFQELEKEAKMASLHIDIVEGGHMICALKQGVPMSYMKSITDLGILMPVGYDKWKWHITIMNQERQ
ncbi:hypothetical protein ARMSODRAFT_972885 [Armillaria solidipes]|uniref:Retrotransposon gag domain-containing protein n=1 Tax=Armillaria solidipes TaxID=1076256 RepID=A0A2H3C5Z5_9AGAR|nr:hypothetical protein ARMSODRAFT_972885 [Armillaria solidipes]